MKQIKNFINEHVILCTAVILLITYIIIIGIIYIIRYFNLASWDSISALGEWAGILIAILIPIAAVYLEKAIREK